MGDAGDFSIHRGFESHPLQSIKTRVYEKTCKITIIVASLRPFIGTDADRCLCLKAGRGVSQKKPGY